MHVSVRFPFWGWDTVGSNFWDTLSNGMNSQSIKATPYFSTRCTCTSLTKTHRTSVPSRESLAHIYVLSQFEAIAHEVLSERGETDSQGPSFLARSNSFRISPNGNHDRLRVFAFAYSPMVGAINASKVAIVQNLRYNIYFATIMYTL